MQWLFKKWNTFNTNTKMIHKLKTRHLVSPWCDQSIRPDVYNDKVSHVITTFMMYRESRLYYMNWRTRRLLYYIYEELLNINSRALWKPVRMDILFHNRCQPPYSNSYARIYITFYICICIQNFRCQTTFVVYLIFRRRYFRFELFHFLWLVVCCVGL